MVLANTMRDAFGLLGALIIVNILALGTIALGALLLKNGNRDGTDLLEDITAMQWVGIAIMVIGTLPLLDYVISAFAFHAVEGLFEAF